MTGPGAAAVARTGARATPLPSHTRSQPPRNNPPNNNNPQAKKRTGGAKRYAGKASRGAAGGGGAGRAEKAAAAGDAPCSVSQQRFAAKKKVARKVQFLER